MKQTFTGITIGCRQDFRQALKHTLGKSVDFSQPCASMAQAYPIFADNPPEIVYLDLTQDPTDMNFAGLDDVSRLMKKHPGTCIFLIMDPADPNRMINGFRAGAADVLPPACSSEQITKSFYQAMERLAGFEKKAELFSVFSLRGGSGVTSLAINLADHIYALTKEKVLLLDLNLFMGDIAGYLDFEPEFTPFELISNLQRMDHSLLFSSLFRHPSGMYVLTASDEINDAESVSADDIHSMVELLKHHFDYIVVDTPHDFSERTLKLLSLTDTLLLTVQQDVPSAKSVQKVIQFLEDIEFPMNHVNIILNRHLKKSEFRAADLEQVFSKTVSHLVQNNYPLMTRAANRGKPLRLHTPKSLISRQFLGIASALAGIKPVNGTSLRQRLFSR